MVSIKLKFRPSIVEGKEGSLYYQVGYNRETRYIATKYKIHSDEWNHEIGSLAVKPISNRANFLEAIKQSVQNDINRILRIEKELISSKISFNIDSIIDEYRKHLNSITLFDYMEQVINHYQARGQLRTGETYLTTLNSFKRFRANVDVYIEDINSQLLEAYENYLKQEALSSNTISFYIKHLRAVYNRAVDDELITDRKPFKRVSTAIEKTPKRAISLRNIKRLKALDCSHNLSRKFARDMFLFSFYTRGMSFVDIAYLQKKNLKGEMLFYRRKKTNQQLTIYWEPCMQKILQTYCADTTSPYLFSIIKEANCDTRKQYQNALFLINRHLKDIGRELGLHQPLTMYCARHSWASIAHEEGIPISVISEGMGHDSEKTTQIYLASLKTEVIDKANRRILKLV